MPTCIACDARIGYPTRQVKIPHPEKAGKYKVITVDDPYCNNCQNKAELNVEEEQINFSDLGLDLPVLPDDLY